MHLEREAEEEVFPRGLLSWRGGNSALAGPEFYTCVTNSGLQDAELRAQDWKNG